MNFKPTLKPNLKPMVAGGLATLGLLMALPASADGHRHGWHGNIAHFERHDFDRWRGGGWRHGWHDGHLGWWWVVAGMWYFYPEPVYPYPDPYRPPVVVVTPPVEIVQPAPPVAPPVQAAPQATQQVWYYCESAQAYYPYVATCPMGWKTVPAVPPQGGAAQPRER